MARIRTFRSKNRCLLCCNNLELKPRRIFPGKCAKIPTFFLTPLEIAELTGKQHKHVMEAIRKMEPEWMKVAASNFRLGSYKDANGQLCPC